MNRLAGGSVRGMGTRRSPSVPDAAGLDSDRYAGHVQAVDALRTAYAGVPAGAPVRLAKRTSNLFRFRLQERLDIPT